MDKPAAVDSQDSILLVEEALDISKQTVPKGTIRAEKGVESRDVVVSERLRTEESQLERISRNIEVDPDHPPQVRIEEGVTIIPVLEEVLVVKKQLILREELHIRTVAREVMSTQHITLKKETLVLSRTDSSGVVKIDN